MTLRYFAYTAVWIFGIGLLLFGAAGDARWPEGWIFLLEYGLLSAALIVWLGRHDPALLRERFAMRHRDQTPWDRMFLTGVAVVAFLWFVLIAVDARRFRWSHVPFMLEAFGALAFAASLFVVWQVFRFNTFAVPQVRAQADRGQKVISDGPYRWVRHPMYSGALLFFVGIPLQLGSWWGLLAAPCFAIALGARAVGEERLLRRELSGYDAYAARVRSRLVPGIW